MAGGEALLGLDDEVDREPMLLGKGHRLFRPHHHEGGVEGVGLERGRGDDAGGDQLVGDGLASGGVDDVGVALAVELVVVAIAAGGAEGHAVGDHHVREGAGLVGRLDDGHPPGFALGVVALAAHGASHLDEVVVHPLLLEQAGNLVGGCPLAQGGEIEVEIGNALAEQEVIPLWGQGQPIDAHLLAGAGDLLGAGALDGTLVRPESPQVDQRAHGDVELAFGEMAGIDALLHDFGHGGGNGHRWLAAALIEAGDEGVRVVGGDLVVHARQQGVDLLLQCRLPTREGVAQGHRIIGAHGLALDTGLGRGRLTGGQHQQQGQQQAAGGRASKERHDGSLWLKRMAREASVLGSPA